MVERPMARAFTLIELLVVIAVILLLAALALPVLDRATRSARRAGCVSNTHQMYASFAAYAQDFKGHLPYTAFEYYKISGRFDSVPALRPYVRDPAILYCTVQDIGPLPDIDDRVGGGGAYCGWNHYDTPGAHYILSNIACFFNPSPYYPSGGYDDNRWAVGTRWRDPKAALISHRRLMRYDLKAWDPADWRCQNWYPHGDYHDMVYGDGRNETRSAAEWQAKPRLWLYWSGDDKCNIFF